MLRLLDFAYMFYSNFTCILTFGELRTDMPCESSLFDCKHPFAEEEFRFSRNTMAIDSLRVLYQASDPVSVRPIHIGMTASLLVESAGQTGSRTITLQDLYLLVHSKLNCPASRLQTGLTDSSDLHHDTDALGFIFAYSRYPGE